MYYIHSLLQRLGTWGLAGSYLLSLVIIILIYFGVIIEDQLEQTDRTILAITSFLAITYLYTKHLYASDKLDKSLFYTYPITTLNEIKNNVQSRQIESFYIGATSKIQKVSGWENIAKQYFYATNTITAYNPDIDRNRQSLKLFGNEKVLGVKYTDGLFQFTQIEPISNDLFESIEYLKPFVSEGIHVHGDFEKLKNAQSQFTAKRWIKMIVIIFVVIVIFGFISIFISAWQDGLL